MVLTVLDFLFYGFMVVKGMVMIMKKNFNPEQNISSTGWLYVFLGIAIMISLGTVYSWSVFRLPIEQLYSIGTTQSGLPYMISLASYSFFMLLSGKYLTKNSPRFTITLGGIIIALGWFLSSYATNIYYLTITYGFIMGSGVGIAYGVPISVVAKWFPNKKGLIVGLVLIGFGVSPFITAPIARYLVVSFGVMKAFQILGITFAVLIPLLSYPMVYPPDTEYSKKHENLSDPMNEVKTVSMIKLKSFKSLYLNFMLGTMIGLILIGMTNNIGVELIRLSEDKVVLLMLLFAVFNGIGRPIFGWLTDKLSYKKAMLISYYLIITAALLMLMANVGSVVLYSIAFSIFWFNLGGWLAIAPTATLALYGFKYYSQNYGVVFTAYGIGAIIGVYASGVVKDVFQSYYAVFYLVIAICVLGIISLTQMPKCNKVEYDDNK